MKYYISCPHCGHQYTHTTSVHGTVERFTVNCTCGKTTIVIIDLIVEIKNDK